MKKHFLLRGFTLAELLMAILVISIIMVALAPVITQRAYDNISIEVNKKKGLEIFTNPGTYTFDVPVGINTLFLSGSGGGGGGAGATFVDKSVTFTSNTTWSVPQGVNQITFTITGSGGGGGAANGTKSSNTSCLYPAEEFLATRGADDESDLCYTKSNLSFDDIAGRNNLNQGETCVGGFCCWRGSNYSCTTGSGSYSGCNRPICTYSAAETICNNYKVSAGKDYFTYRLPSQNELTKLNQYFDSWVRRPAGGYDSGIRLCTWGYRGINNEIPDEIAQVPRCATVSNCLGANNNNCDPCVIWSGTLGGIGVYAGNYQNYSGLMVYPIEKSSAFTSRCVYKISRWQNRTSGAGGASGAQLTQTINVLPQDTLTITIGTGGFGGTYNSNSGKGSQGGTTQIVHKRNGAVLGTYYVKGGLGGYGAAATTNGSAYSTSEVTPSGTCYAKTNTTCTKPAYSGTAGTSNAGGNGGRVANSGTATAGGTLYIDSTRAANTRNTTTEASYAKGQNAAIAGFGGGGGFTPGWAVGSENFYPGGKGANGKVGISYKVILPGGGGGAAGSAGLNSDRITSELTYRVEEGTRIVFTIGQGGDGGQEGQNGLDGTNTIIDDNAIIFYAGKGGKISTDAQKSSLLGGLGGEGAGVLYNGTVINTGSNGMQGQFKVSNAYQNYGFDGGVGGKTFLNFDGGCGGGIIKENPLTYNCLTSSLPNGTQARAHDPINDRHGGAGGGGGGAAADSFVLGSGGAGSSGYLRIRWDESENKD